MRLFLLGFAITWLATVEANAEEPCMKSPIKFDKDLLDGVITKFKKDYRAELKDAQDKRRRTSLIDYFVDPFMEPYCDQVKDIIPGGDCTCEVHLFELQFAFSCNLSDAGMFNGTVNMLSMDISSSVEYSVAGQTIGLKGNHCSDDPQNWCSCSATLNGQSCTGG